MYIKEWNWRINFRNLLRFEGSSVSGQNQFCTSWCPCVSGTWHPRIPQLHIPRDVAEDWDLRSHCVHLCKEHGSRWCFAEEDSLVAGNTNPSRAPVRPTGPPAFLRVNWEAERGSDCTGLVWASHQQTQSSPSSQAEKVVPKAMVPEPPTRKKIPFPLKYFALISKRLDAL